VTTLLRTLRRERGRSRGTPVPAVGSRARRTRERTVRLEWLSHAISHRPRGRLRRATGQNQHVTSSSSPASAQRERSAQSATRRVSIRVSRHQAVEEVSGSRRSRRGRAPPAAAATSCGPTLPFRRPAKMAAPSACRNARAPLRCPAARTVWPHRAAAGGSPSTECEHGLAAQAGRPGALTLVEGGSPRSPEAHQPSPAPPVDLRIRCSQRQQAALGESESAPQFARGMRRSGNSAAVCSPARRPFELSRDLLSDRPSRGRGAMLAGRARRESAVASASARCASSRSAKEAAW
jgi:hypothetical protein